MVKRLIILLLLVSNLVTAQSFDKESVKNSKGQFYIRQINKEWKGSKSDNPLEGTTGSERKEIARIIDVNFRDSSGKLVKGDANGVLSYPTARLANADPRQLNKKQGTLQTVGVMDLQNSIAGKKSNRETMQTNVMKPSSRDILLVPRKSGSSPYQFISTSHPPHLNTQIIHI